MNHQTLLTVFNATPENEQEKFFKALGIVRPKLGKPNKPKLNFADYTANIIRKQAERNRNKN